MPTRLEIAINQPPLEELQGVRGAARAWGLGSSRQERVMLANHPLPRTSPPCCCACVLFRPEDSSLSVRSFMFCARQEAPVSGMLWGFPITPCNPSPIHLRKGICCPSGAGRGCGSGLHLHPDRREPH